MNTTVSLLKFITNAVVNAQSFSGAALYPVRAVQVIPIHAQFNEAQRHCAFRYTSITLCCCVRAVEEETTKKMATHATCLKFD